MAHKIDNPATCEVRSVIRFLNAENVRPSEIHRRITEVYGTGTMDESSVRRWVRNFKQGRDNVHDEERSGRPSLITDDLKKRVDDFIRKDRRVKLSELSKQFPEISRSLLYEIVTDHLNYRKICSRWVPKMLTDQHKTNRMGSALSFLTRYEQQGDAFLDQIVTGDETWVCHFTPETKRKSMEWHHPQSPTRPRKFKQSFSMKKVMASVFWDRKGLLLVDFMPQKTTINADAYCETLQRLRRAIQNKRRGMLTRGIVLLHDNARPHTAQKTTNLLRKFKWEVFDHPPYSPDLAPSDFHLFTKLKDFLSGERFQSDDDLREGVQHWLANLAVEVYEEGINKLVSRYDKCFNNFGDYIEK